METYVYFYKNDTTYEAIGRVKATSLDEARDYVVHIKQLSKQQIDDLFVIKRAQDHENNIRHNND